jgi:hypothetical protein
LRSSLIGNRISLSPATGGPKPLHPDGTSLLRPFSLQTKVKVFPDAALDHGAAVNVVLAQLLGLQYGRVVDGLITEIVTISEKKNPSFHRLV